MAPPPECSDADGAPLRTARFVGGTGGTGTDTGTGHLYAYVQTMAFESWHEARDAAAALTCCGAPGRLLVITDDAERNFVREHVLPANAGTGTGTGAVGWTGLVDETNDGVWSVGGPTPPAGSENSAASTTPTPVDCGTDSTYDDKDYLYGVRCREAARLPILVEFACSALQRPLPDD